MPTDGIRRPAGMSFAEYSQEVLDRAGADLARHQATGVTADPVTVNLTGLSDDDARTVVGQVATCGFEVVLIDDRFPARPGTIRSEQVNPQSQGIMRSAKVARLAEEKLADGTTPGLP